MKPIAAADIPRDISEEYATYLRHFIQQRARFERTMASFGVPVSSDSASAERTAALRRQLEEAGAHVRNGGKSIAWKSISPACERCRTGVKSISEFLSLACHRSCWFCFNENQCDYHLYENAQKDWRGELSAFRKTMGGLDYIALTGGEPLLHPDDACAFFTQARRENPNAHLRLYTSGDQLSPELLSRLKASGLDEIRFSVKLDDPSAAQKRTLERIRAAVGVIPAVLVEMPVVPGTHDEMRHLLHTLEQAGVFGINLLELCFPLHHAEAFTSRGLALKANPYAILYDYGYAGALPVEGSEALALQLMLEEMQRNTALHMHYCSLENKNTAQIYEQNDGGKRAIPLYDFSHENFFYTTLRCFGSHALELADELDDAGCAHALDEEGRMVQFAPHDLPFVRQALDNHGIRLFAAFGVIEREGAGGARFREVDALVVKPADYQALYLACAKEV